MARKLPSFQFYPGDWMKEPSLRCISHAAKGVYVDMLCLAFECEDRGVLATGGTPWSDQQIAAAVGGPQDVTLACIAELLAMGVVSRTQAGAIFSRRMVREENNRQQDAERKRRQRACHGDVPPDVTPVSEGEDEAEEPKGKKKKGRPPDLPSVIAYFDERGASNPQDEGERWWDYFESVGWLVGKKKAPMKDWQACIRNWMRDKRDRAGRQNQTFDAAQQYLESEGLT